MLKKTIKYEDFDGLMQEEVFYFNLSKPELMELEVRYKSGFSNMLNNIMETNNNKELFARFKEIILLSYGIRSEDGKRFIKSRELREEFSQSFAYESLFMELLSSDQAAAIFVKGILPKDIGDTVNVNDLVKRDDSTSPPVPTN